MKKTLVIFLLIFCLNSLYAQDTEIWIKNSPEIRLNFRNNPFEIRWRPIDQMVMPEYYTGKKTFVRTDLMLGINMWKLKIFNYSKYDQFHSLWTGARLDLNLDFFDKKVLLNIQERYFWGLNSSSADHYYLIQYLRYSTNKKIALGILSYGKWKTERDFTEGKWFVGPSLEVGLPYNFSFMTVFARNILPYQNKVYMWFFRIGYRFKLGKEKQ